MAWAREEARLETLKYKQERESKAVQIIFHADRQLDYDRQNFFRGGYLFLQSVYYSLQLHKTCRKLKAKYKFEYDINAILSDLIYSRVLEPASKRSSFKTASEFLEKPSYRLYDVYRALDVLSRKKVRVGNKLPYSVTQTKTAVLSINTGLTAVLFLINCQRQDYTNNVNTFDS